MVKWQSERERETAVEGESVSEKVQGRRERSKFHLF